MSEKANVYTAANGAPVPNPYPTQRIGKVGPLLMQDNHFIQSTQQFNREKIPERIVHANGGGAFGEFECTKDVSDLTCASFLKPGKKSECVVRYSTVAGEAGSADTARDPRGFSTKIKTDEGVIDWVYNNTPVFFIRDPLKFNYFIHSQKRNPATNLKDPNMFWDYLTNNVESLHQVMTLFSDRGTPASWRNMHCYSGNTYKWVKEDGSFVYVQIHVKADGGFKTLKHDEAVKLAGENPDYNQADLYDAIERGEYPTWTCYVQTMTPEQAEKAPFSVFDLTKVWPHGDYPLREFGKLTLNKNAANFFAEIEQVAFAPSNTVPGWEPSADPVLQSRLFSYQDAQRYRLGTNFMQIPVNRPLAVQCPYQRNGSMRVDNNYGGELWYPNRFEDLKLETKADPSNKHEEWTGRANSFVWTVEDDSEHEQARGMWKAMGPEMQKTFVYNVAVHAQAAREDVRERVCNYFALINSQLGEDIGAKMKELMG